MSRVTERVRDSPMLQIGVVTGCRYSGPWCNQTADSQTRNMSIFTATEGIDVHGVIKLHIVSL